VNYAFDSLLNYSVAKQIYEVLNAIKEGNDQSNGINRPRRRSLNYFGIMQKANFDLIIYSALAIESFINKLGICIYGNKYATERIYKGKTLERCTIHQKIEEITKNIYGKMEDVNKPEYAKLKRLFSNRDDLVHDKPEVVDGLFFGLQKSSSIDSIAPEDAFNTLIYINNLFHGYKYNNDSVSFISDIIENDYYLFKKENMISVDSNLPFSEAKFSDIYLYRY
jgi:hypothetical protein